MAGLPDQQILDRMRTTGQVFELNPEQQAYLRNNGVDGYVIDQIPQINREVRDNLLTQPAAPAGTPSSAPVYRAPAYSPVPTSNQPITQRAGPTTPRTIVGFSRVRSRVLPRC
jgi:hypothetical protein